MSPADNRSDEQLVRLCNEGTREEAQGAFDALYTRHKDYVLRVAYRYTSDAELALDVLQNTFVYLLRKFPPSGDGLTLSANLRTLLYKSAKNSALTKLRNRNLSARDSEADPDEIPVTPRDDSELDRLLLGTAKSRLHKAVSALRKSPYVKDFFEK